MNVSPEDQEKYKSPKWNKSLWTQMNEQGWAETFGPRLLAKEVIRNTGIYDGQISFGVWFAVVARTARMDDVHLIREVPHLSPHVRMGDDPGDSDVEMEIGRELIQHREAAPLGNPSSSTVELIIVGAAELKNMKETDNTPLGLHCTHLVTWSCIIHAVMQHCCSCMHYDMN